MIAYMIKLQTKKIFDEYQKDVQNFWQTLIEPISKVWPATYEGRANLICHKKVLAYISPNILKSYDH